MTHHPDIVAEARGHSAYAGDLYDRLAALIETQAAEIALRDAILLDVASYHRGEGKYHFAHLSPDERGIAMLDAWDGIWEKLKPLATAIASGVIEEKGSGRQEA